FSIEFKAWDCLYEITNRTGRIIDRAYSFVSRLFAELLWHEETANHSLINSSQSAGTAEEFIQELQSKLLEKNDIIELADEAVRSGSLPTPHSHLQSILTDIGRAFIESYGNWSGILSKLDLIPLRYSDFIASKSWSAVCAKGYIYWSQLRVRCFGALPSDNSDNTTISSSGQFTPLPASPLHAANVVRLHGRTLVRFMLQRFEKERYKRSYTSESDKENTQPNSLNASAIPIGHSNSLIWGNGSLNEVDLLNTWLGTRLLLEGCQQVAELYTLLGTVREARAYLDELLRAAQRFHVPA
ncbi:unnamed protein product, partial [Protopolystoma xenopodis]